MFELIPDITAQRAQLKPDATAFRDLTLGTSLTYAELEANVQRVAGVFAANGVAAGDRVAVLCRNRVEFFELLFACAKVGAAPIGLDAYLFPDFRHDPLHLVRVRVL